MDVPCYSARFISPFAQALSSYEGYAAESLEKLRTIDPGDAALRYLLHDDDATFGEIAFRLGFSHVEAFHRAFRRWTGTTPLAYRRSRGVRLA
jgi:YesN/AraC family two-component response regulator